MINKEKITELVNQKLTDDQFLVDVTVSPTNVIHILVDSDTAITINQIVEISRYVESGLDRETEDFELSVFSAGLSEPFRLARQYKKNVGTEVEVLLVSGLKLKGKLTYADDLKIELETTSKEKKEGSKKKEIVLTTHTFDYKEIKETKIILKF